MPIIKGSKPITSLEEWEVRAGPKAAHQWVDGRSAKEAARSWLEGDGITMPHEIQAAVTFHSEFGNVLHREAEPEAKLRFDTFPGEPRNSDLSVVVQDANGSYLLAVEAKADEEFGETIEAALLSALDRKDQNPRSNGVARIEQLISALLPPRTEFGAPLRGLRYQLFTATAGALCEAERRGFNRAVLLVQEFVTPKTNDKKHKGNAQDLQTFVSRLTGGIVADLENGIMYGPITVPGKPPLRSQIDFYIGKVARYLRTHDA